MSQFIFFAALLCLLAIALAVSALWQRSRKLALALAIGLPLAAAGLYHLKGNAEGVNPAVAVAPKTIEDAVAQLEQRIASEPENFEGMALLGRSYMALGKYDKARDAYARALKLKPEDTDLSVEYAEAMLRAATDRRFPPEALAILETAVAKNPQNQRALFFLGTYQMQEQHPADAVATWEKLLPLLDAPTARELRKQIDEARAAAGMPALPPLPAETASVAGAEPAAAAAATDGAAIEIDVQIDPKLAAQAKAGDVLYVFARSTDGAGPPFAAKRIELGALPLHIQLSDADSPMPAARLSAQTKVLLMARLSRSGDVKAASGDIEAAPVQVEVGGKSPVVLLLNHQVP